MKNKILYVAAIGLSIFMLFFVIGATWIGFEVKRTCKEAQGVYGGDCVEALVNTLQEEKSGFRRRNYAIWALGQMGDKRALSSLKTYYTGTIAEREPYDKGISQYELKKAIRLINEGVNITAFIWR